LSRGDVLFRDDKRQTEACKTSKGKKIGKENGC